MFLVFMTIALFWSQSLAWAQTPSAELKSVTLPHGDGGIGFDDMEFVSDLRKVLVPGGRTGKLYLVDPKTEAVDAISGFSIDQSYRGGHGQSITSADEANGLVFIADRDTQQLHLLDPKRKTVLASVSLASKPDYVRYIKSTNEVWVTQPSSEQIEVFKFWAQKYSLSHQLFIAVQGGPESLIEDHVRQHVYTHLWDGKTIVIDARTHAIINTWSNGCESSRGIALDEKRGFLFVGCAEGKAVVLDLNHYGKELSTLSSGTGVDVIAYNPGLSHLYLPGAESATMAILKVSSQGRLSLLGTVKTSKGAHCASADNQKNVWICDPGHGQLLRFKDSL